MQILNHGSSRSVKAKKNICRMLLIKGGNILTGILLVPITLGYVNSDTYGLWIALSSMIAWMRFFDIGMNNGLKNNLAKVLATGEYDKAKTYISTTYCILTLIFIPLMFILIYAVPYIDWHSLLNIDHVNGLSVSICVIVAYFCINFILSTINIVLIADQRPADASFWALIQQIVSLVIIFILTRTTQGSLLNLCLAFCVSPVVVVALFSFTLFKGRYKHIAPSLKNVDFRQASFLMKLGIQFFIIQIAGIIQYQMINFLIMRYYGASDVTAYNIACKYFNILTMVWGILTAPLWVAFTDAMTKSDIRWIQNVLHKYFLAFLVFSVMGGIMLVLSSRFYDIWVGDSVTITFHLSSWIFIYNVVTMYSNIYVSFINGTGNLKIQTIACCISPFVFLAVCFGLMKTELGISSILIAAIVANFNGFILAPIQTYRLIRTCEKNKE